MSASHERRLALRQVLPVILAIFPFGAVYGTVAAENGLTLAETLGLSGVVYAGASQLVAVQLMATGAPLWAVIVSIVALNFRHVLYSASIGRHLAGFSGWQKAIAFFFLVDPVFGAAEGRAARGRLTRTYYFTYALLLYATWMTGSFVGAIFGGLIENPRTFGIDFVLPVYFLALVMGFHKRRGFVPVAATSAIVSILVYETIGSPWHVTLGGLAGILLAAARAPAHRPRRLDEVPAP